MNNNVIINEILETISNLTFMIDENIRNTYKKDIPQYSMEQFKDILQSLFEFTEEGINSVWFDRTSKDNQELYISAFHEIELVLELVKKYEEVTPIEVLSDSIIASNESNMGISIENFLTTTRGILNEIVG